MKGFLFSSIFILIFCSSYAQKQQSDYSNIITTKKLVVRSKRNPTDKPSIYLIPVVSKKYPKLRDALCDTNLFNGEKLDSVVKEYQTTGAGFTSFSYEVTFANSDIISLKLYYEYEGAYPSEYQRWLTLNIHTGKTYYLNNELNLSGLNWIHDKYKKILRKRILEDKGDENCNHAYYEMKTAINKLKSKTLFKKYIFTKDGVMVSMEKMLPHVDQECEPDRDVLIPYNKLESFKASTAIVVK
ncbi:MAG TPA: hypothetical protein VL442_06615 [Mucilaginibacter sp.]|jgi:hypothetical protein|nr:hypothetical protein [Mucilaginibacter sp.]